ncbi:thioesterase domain-containing protein [Mycolicibacterium neoaurum]|uniref:thioesterase domain-containing protein n=1 Tax=Mycolicibacterium neoaurum TaxID=1795 RepID=UPI001F4C5FCB|nr:non-ribosomal peptide synthetase [Mycolicibacterium neoaurum]
MPQHPREHSEIELCRIWSAILGEQVADIDLNFFLDLGGTSQAAVRLLVDVQVAFGVDLKLASLLSAPTVRQLSEIVADQHTQGSSSPIVRIQDGNGECPLYLFHPLPGTLVRYFPLVAELGADATIFGLQSFGIEKGTRPLNEICDMADAYLAHMLSQHNGGPWRLIGYSMGGYLAVEVARRLLSAREDVRIVCAVGSELSNAEIAVDEGQLRTITVQRLALIMLNVDISSDILCSLSFEQQIQEVIRRGIANGSLTSNSHVDRFLRFLDVRIRNFIASERYRASAVYEGNLTLVRAADSPVFGDDGCDGWGSAARTIDVYETPGDHFSMMDKPHVACLANTLRDLLARTG